MLTKLRSKELSLNMNLLPFMLAPHMGAEPKNSIKRGSRGIIYGKLTARHHISRYYVSPNQSCKVFGDFGPKS